MRVDDTAAGTAPAVSPVAPDARGRVRPLSWFTRTKFDVVRAFLLAWVRLFGLRGLYLLGGWFGTAEYLINFRRRTRYRRELRRVFPEGLSQAAQTRSIHNYFRRTRRDKLYYLIFDRLPRDKIMRRIRFQGRAHLDAALERGHGVYVMLSHHGSHHVAALLTALLGYRCAGVRDRNEGTIRTYVQEKYAQTFPEYAAVRVLYADSFPRDIYRCFQENRIVGSASDVRRERGAALRTCPVRIFGQTRHFLVGPLQIALRCRATICQAFVVSRANFYYQIVVHQPFLIPGEDHDALDDPELIRRIMQQYADGIAAHSREHPDHLSRI